MNDASYEDGPLAVSVVGSIVGCGNVQFPDHLRRRGALFVYRMLLGVGASLALANSGRRSCESGEVLVDGCLVMWRVVTTSRPVECDPIHGEESRRPRLVSLEVVEAF